MTELDALLDGAVANGDVPGLVAMVADGEDLLYAHAAGRLSAGAREEMPLNAIFWLASMTKLVTSIAAMQLVEQGKLALDAPIGQLLPDLAEPQVLAGFDAAGRGQFRPASRAITLRHLLTHTAGIGYDTMNPELMRARGAAGPPAYTSLASIKGPLLFDPGDGWEYGFSTDWVGLAVEAVSGESLDTYFRANILNPLGMRDTGFAVPPGKAYRWAALHVRVPDAGFAPVPSPVEDRSAWEFFSGGAGLLGTAGDYIRLLRALLNGGELQGARVLRAETAAEMARNQVGGLRAGKLNTAVPAYYLPFDLFPEMRTQWGLACLINPDPVPGGRAAGSFGWSGVANTCFWADPSRNLCAVLMTQLMPFADPCAMALAHSFESAVYAAFPERR